MKKILFSALLFLMHLVAQSQEIKFDGLKAPSSPAFNLLGISPSSIDQPTDITSLAASVQSASNNFNSIPKNYAMEFLPYTLFSTNSMTTIELDNKKLLDVFKQTFLISVGVNNELKSESDLTIPKLTKLGLGIKFSLIRPSFDSLTKVNLVDLYESQKKLLDESAKIEFNDNLLNSYDDLMKKIEELKISDEEKSIKLKEIIILKQKRKIELYKDFKENLKTDISKKAKSLEFKRTGAFLDFACGSVIDFKDETFNRSQVSKGGAWLTGGYSFKSSIDILGIARYLYQPDKLLADDTGKVDTKNISSLDGGLRIVYKTLKNEQLSISTESIYRSVLNHDSLSPSWRFVFNTSYNFSNNRIVTFSFGKDFDNSYIKGNNLIATLNFIIGLGSKVTNDTNSK